MSQYSVASMSVNLEGTRVPGTGMARMAQPKRTINMVLFLFVEPPESFVFMNKDGPVTYISRLE